MTTTRQISITLPDQMADTLSEHVRSGEYASESEVVREALDALFARDSAVESWLLNEVVPAAKAMAADPSRGITADELRENLAERRARR